MVKQIKSVYALVLVAILVGCSALRYTEVTHYYQAQTTKPYDEVMAELRVAITDHNFRVTGHSAVGKVIREREEIDFPDYDTIQFCNLTHAKRLLEFSPDSVRHMPCNVVLYSHQGRVIIKTRLMPTNTANPELNAFSEKMNEQLKAIVDFAAEE